MPARMGRCLSGLILEVGLRRTSGTVDSPLPPIAISTCPCPAMRNEGRLRNEPNKPLVFSLLVRKGVREK